MAAPMLICQTLLCLLGSQAKIDPSQLQQSQPLLQTRISNPITPLNPPISVSYTAPNKAMHNGGGAAKAAIDDGDDEALNSDKSKSSASWTSPTAAESGASWPPLFVASDNAQRFFDRIHGFAEKPVGDEDNGGGAITTTAGNSATASTKTTIKYTANEQQLDDVHANTIDSEVLATTTPRSHTIANQDALLKNWIYTHSSVDSANRPLVRVRKDIPLIEKTKPQIEESRQMFTSLSERIFANLAANNPYVNWTQSPTPQAVYGSANLPIAQIPFVHLAPSTPSPQRTEKPPRKGWFSFASRPLRIYGEGTESKFPPLIERMVQRIQHYFSVFKYEDTSRPLVSQASSGDGQTVSAVDVQTNNDGLDELVVEVKPLSEGTDESKPSGDFVVYVGNFNLDDENGELAFEQVTQNVGDSNMFDEEDHATEIEHATTESEYVSLAEASTEIQSHMLTESIANEHTSISTVTSNDLSIEKGRISRTNAMPTTTEESLATNAEPLENDTSNVSQPEENNSVLITNTVTDENVDSTKTYSDNLA